MADVPNVPGRIMAPFVTDYNPETGVYTAMLNKTVIEHLNKPQFTEEVTPDKVPGYTRFNLIPTHSVGVDTEASIEKLIGREFGNSQWTGQVRDLLKKKGVISTTSNWVPDEPTYSKYGLDNYYTVCVDNLPENDGRDEIADLLRSYGCYYFDRVIVPFDDETGQYKLCCFVKFQRLRWALKFCEDFQNIKLGNMLLGVSLAV